MSDTVCYSEMMAYSLLYGEACSTDCTSFDIHKAADKIILLAEKIKAERSVAAMCSGLIEVSNDL